MVKKNSTKTKVQPYEIGELDHYLFGKRPGHKQIVDQRKRLNLFLPS